MLYGFECVEEANAMLSFGPVAYRGKKGRKKHHKK